MDFGSKFDKNMRLKRCGLCFVVLLTLFIIWKLSVIETSVDHSVDRIKNLREVLELQKEKLDERLQLLSQQQVSLVKLLDYNNVFNIEKKTSNIPIIYAITPTYWRHVQKAELTRISQTLMLVPNIHWIIIEDSETKSDLVRNIILESKLVVTHLNAKTPQVEKLKDKDQRWKRHRGVDQRNMGLKWLRDNLHVKTDKGVVYFMDDDNTYNYKLFAEIAKVKRVGVWPVGLVGGLNVETPILDSVTGKVSGYRSGWKPNRPFAIDMAGFAINLDILLSKPEAQFSYTMEKGLQESEFLSYFTTKEELEPLADNCTKVYVWHTRTEKAVVNGLIPGFEV